MRSLINTKTPFLHSIGAIVILLLVVIITLFSFSLLVDRSPPCYVTDIECPPSHYEPGYTLSDKRTTFLLNASVRSFADAALSILIAASLFVLICERLSRRDPRRRPVKFWILVVVLYAITALGLFNLGWGFHYIPSSTPLTDRLTFGFIVVLGVQSFLVGLVVIVFSHPLVPSVPLSNPGDYFQMHLRNWWRYGQILISFSVAIGFGLFIPIVTQASPLGRGGIWLTAVFLFTPIGAMMVFLLLKIHYVGRVVKEQRLL